MILLVLGVGLIVFLILSCCLQDYKIWTNVFGGLALACFIGLGVFATYGLLSDIPVTYEESELTSSNKLIAIDNDLYVYQMKDHYYCSISNQTEPYGIHIDDCKIVEEVECQLPRVEIYKSDAKVSFWHLFASKKIEYVIYVPVGTVTD